MNNRLKTLSTEARLRWEDSTKPMLQIAMLSAQLAGMVRRFGGCTKEFGTTWYWYVRGKDRGYFALIATNVMSHGWSRRLRQSGAGLLFAGRLS